MLGKYCCMSNFNFTAIHFSSVSSPPIPRTLSSLGYLEFWHAILIDVGSLLVVVMNGTRLLSESAFKHSDR